MAAAQMLDVAKVDVVRARAGATVSADVGAERPLAERWPLDGLLKEQVRSDPEIAGMLASYNHHPAFFYQKSPLDTDRAWQKPNYPRADYNVDLRYDPEHKTAGTLTVNVWCTSQSGAMPEDIEGRLLELINGTFYTEQGQDTICAVWNRSDAFAFESAANTQNNKEPEVFGITLLFDLLSFPSQLTTDPDPIEAFNRWTKENFAPLCIIAHDALPSVWKPTDANPAIYWRFIGADTNDRQSFSVTWCNGQFAAHIIAATVVERNRWIKALVEKMRINGEILLADGSPSGHRSAATPLFIKQAVIRHAADPLREGQVTITGQYGVLTAQRKICAQNPLNHAFNLNEIEADKHERSFIYSKGTGERGAGEIRRTPGSGNDRAENSV
jgi:hypothetical protein